MLAHDRPRHFTDVDIAARGAQPTETQETQLVDFTTKCFHELTHAHRE
jgi:hypothetical protein